MKLSYNEFCEEMKKGRLLGLKCKNCGTTIFPPKAFCPGCGKPELEKIEMTKSGTLKSFTVIRVAPEGFKPPYIVAIVELPEGPMVMGNLEYDPDKADFSLIGKKVSIGYKIVPGDKYSGGEGLVLTFSLDS